MNQLSQVFAFFCAQMAFGSAMLMPLMPIREIGKSFQQFYSGYNLFFLGLFVWLLSRSGHLTNNYLIITAVFGWVFVLSFLQKQMTKTETYLNILLTVISLGFITHYARHVLLHGYALSAQIWPVTAMVIGGLFLAFSLMTMIFGHWYLINTSLDFSHLVTVTKRYLILTYTRILVALITLYFVYQTQDSETIKRLTDLAGHGIFFWARILAGLAVPLLVAHLAYASAKIKSNQSATGILYAGCVFVLMGELMAIYLFSLIGIYL